jgi:serine protease Do
MIDSTRTLLTSATASVATSLVVLGVYSAANSSSAATAVHTPITGSPAVTQTEGIPATVQRTEPAVVSVVITKDVPVMEQYFEERDVDPFSNPFFSPFSIQIPQYRQNGTEQREVGGGSAFFVSADGILMTNKHVVDDPDASYTVFLNDGKKLEATVLATDPTNDIALLKVKGDAFPYLTLSDTDPVLGQTVIAIGNALAEFRNTVSVGVVSGLSRSITAGSQYNGASEQLSHIIQTDAAINQGNSGGPLLDAAGNVIGMNTAVASGAQNIGFALPAGDLKRVLESYKQYGRIVRPYIGIRYAPITPSMKERNKLDYDYGVVVVRGDATEDTAVIPGSPADKAGILENDIILEADGEKITEENPLAVIIQRKLPGDTLALKLSSKGKEKDVVVTLEEWKE